MTSDVEAIVRVVLLVVEDEQPLTEAMREHLRERLTRAIAAMPDRPTLPNLAAAHNADLSWQDEQPTLRGHR